MAISDNDTKLLWGRAAAFCSNPNCRADLSILTNQGLFNIGEMAHIIAKSPAGPRGNNKGGKDEYKNLILLCPKCHRTVDKAPKDAYPESLLHAWKTEHEAHIRESISNQIFAITLDLKQFISPLLAENHMLWKEFGPNSDAAISDPGSNLHNLWALRKIGRIIPNNNKIIKVIEKNIGLLDKKELDAFLKFKIHAESFELNQENRLDTYPTFPQEFSDQFEL